MLERSLEILVRRCACDLFAPDWTLIAQQLSLPSGRLDLLFVDGGRRRQLVELKKGRAGVDAIEQALRYAADVSGLLDGAPPVPWVVAHEIPDTVVSRARSAGVRTLAVTPARCEALIQAHGLTNADLLGSRRASGVLHGGGARGGLRKPVPNAVAFRSMPARLAELLETMERLPFVEVRSGTMQTVIHYRGVKLGGINRIHRGGVAYVAEGVVIREVLSTQLTALGFRRMSKRQQGSAHEHQWWEISYEEVAAVGQAFELARATVDRALGVNMAEAAVAAPPETRG